MKDKVIKPHWSKFDVINSQIIANFFEAQGIAPNSLSFDLNDLRIFYRNDRINASILIDEFSLRGFDFITERSNGFFPEKCNAKKIIKVKSPLDCFKKINFFLLGLGNFVNKFKVCSDLFFDYVPLEGFLRINNKIPMDMLENEFLNAGFDIIEIPTTRTIKLFDIIRETEYPKLVNTLKNNNIYTLNGFFNNFDELINKTSNLNKYDICRLKLMRNWFDETLNLKDIRNVDITYYFDSCDMKFLNYCKNNELTKVVELINDESIKEYDKFIVTYFNTFVDYLKFYYYVNVDDSTFNMPLYFISTIGTSNTIDLLKENNITSVGDILIHDLKSISGLGVGKINGIYNAVLDFIGDSDSKDNPSIQQIPQSLYTVKIDDLITYSGLGVAGFLEFCNKNNLVYIKDLSTLDLTRTLRSINMLGKIKSDEIIKLLTNEKYNVSSKKELMKVLSMDFKNNFPEMYSVIYERIINDKTLEELGLEQNVTRERIRQIEAKAFRILKGFTSILFEYLEDEAKCICVSVDLLNDLLDDYNYSKIIFGMLRPCPEVFSIDTFDKIFIKCNCENIENLFDEIYKFLDCSTEGSKDILTSSEIDDFITNKIISYGLEKYICKDDFNLAIANSNYKKVGDVWLKKGIYIHDIYLTILKDFYPNGVKFDDDNCNEIRKRYFEITGGETDITNKNLTAKLQREENVIICGPNSYIHIDNVKVPDRMLDTIKKYINHLFEHEGISSVYTDKIYNVFKDELNFYGVDNYNYLFGILRYHYINDFDFSNFWITKNGKSDSTRDIALIDYLKNDTHYNVGIPKEKIISLFGLTGPYLINIIYNSKEIKECHNKENLIYVGNYKLSDNLLSKIKNYIVENMERQFGFISIKHLLSKFDIYFEEEGIIDEITLSDVLTIYLSDYHIKDLYVCMDSIDKDLDEYFFFDLFINKKSEFTRKDFEDFAKEKGIYSNRIYDVLKNRFSNLYQINISDFISNINITNEQVEAIYKIINFNIETKNYVLLSDLKKNGDIYKMPNLGYSWNEYLLRSILVKNMKEDFILIDIPGPMLFTERGILIRKELTIDNYIDFLKYIYMNNHYYELENVNQLFKELQASGLINDTLPAEFKKIIVDDYGRLIRC